MRIVFPVLVFALFALACEDVLPVKTEDLCEGTPPSAECPQCAQRPFAEDCPQCRGDTLTAGCANAIEGTGGGSGASGAAGGGVTDGGVAAGAGGAGGAGAGGAGGTSGAGGSGDPCAACGQGEHCLDGSCVGCRNHDDCAGERDLCDPAAHECVACLEQSDCGGSTPLCQDHECVQCVGDGDCDATAPKCGAEHECGPCTGDGDCAERQETPLCDTRAAAATAGRCVQCLTHEDCENPTPECSGGTCMPCSGNAACEGRTGTEVCNDDQDSDTFGWCVQCTGATEADRCGARACKRSTGTCTNVNRGAVGLCNACEADSECLPGARCVFQSFGTGTFGPYCFFEKGAEGGCADENPARRPYSQTALRTSIDGEQAEYCLPITTCAAINDAIQQQSCSNDGDCGEVGLPDGDCPESGPASGKCSYQCTTSDDCPNTGFSMCGGAGANTFCQ